MTELIKTLLSIALVLFNFYGFIKTLDAAYIINIIIVAIIIYL